VLLLVARRYGWHRDELYFLEAGKHLAWGYVDQPPFTPFVARVANAIAPGNLVALRATSAVSTGTAVVVGGLIARELGARRSGQVFAAAAIATGGFALGVGHLLATAAFDYLAWLILLWIVTRMLRTDEPRHWLLFGGVAGLAMFNKNLVPLLCIALLVGLVVERRWSLLRTWWLAAGIAVALLVASPNLVWQAANGWPQLDMARVLSDRLGVENRVTLVPLQLLFIGPGLTLFLYRGARWLSSTEESRQFRPLLWAWPTAIVAALITAGRPYYVLPVTTVVLIAGFVATDLAGRPSRTVLWWLVPNAILTLPLALPLLPMSQLDGPLAAPNEAVLETVGWPQLVEQLSGVVAGLPVSEREQVVLLTGSYGEAGAIDRFGPAFGLPHAVSPHNGYWYFRQPRDDGATVVAVGFKAAYLEQLFDTCDHVAEVDNRLDVPNEAQGKPIIVCRGLRGSWDEVWPRLKFLS
jgi:4-amino-4-deoxy-L-arabinose transferase-like glycosyltransferase